ncbi:MAG: amino acid adenylation domain-containing protein, partial [Oscillochloris sp.]|nr:amino acid adenylation domain-containing protein [Oscillochloris sp.]
FPILQPWFARHGDQRPQLVNMYGITETTVHVTYRPLSLADLSTPTGSAIGEPIPDLTLYILDQHQQLVPVGVPGELYVGGAGVARGYLNRPELTAQRFIESEQVAGWMLQAQPHSRSAPASLARIYKTGDLARFRASGDIEYLGRIDEQVKLRGFRIELGEIAAALAQYPGVDKAMVLVRAIAGSQQLVAYLTVNPGLTPFVADLRAFLRTRLPEYMVPAFFMTLESFPLNANGKVDRKALPAPDQTRDERDGSYVAPRSAVERFLAGIWQEVLGIERVGIHDNFFERGGDSLQAAVLTNRIQEELQVAAHVRAVFMTPNIADLARYIEEYYPEAVRQLGDDASGPVAAPTAIIAGSAGAGQIDAAKVRQIRAIIPTLPAQPVSVRNSAKNPRAVFVLSPPRSGSTLLRTMLAGNPQLFAPPELDLLSFNTLAERRDAFSGDHSFWLEGPIRALMELLNVDVEQASQVMAGYERDQMTIKAFYGRLQQQLGARYLVDKTPVYPLDPAILQRMEDDFDQPYYVHLVRHPHASVYSFMEAKLDHIFFRYSHPFAQRELAELVWIISHEHILAFLQGIPAERQCQISFEELVSQPDPEMRRLCDFLGIPFAADMLKPYEGKRMTDGIRSGAQMVGDFKFYLRNSIDPRAANRWQQFHTEEFLSPISWEIARRLGYQVPVAEPARLATTTTNLQPLLPTPRDQDLPLSFAQQRLWFLDQLEPGSPLYNIPSARRLHGPLRADLLEQSINAILRRHEVLRTTFAAQDGRARQVIGTPDTRITLRRIDLTALSAETKLIEANRLSAVEARQPFDLSTGPLLRVSLLRLAADDHVMLLTMHHIIADGWSIGVIIRELGALYTAFLHGQPDPLSDLPVQYADVAAWQRAWVASPAMTEQLDYWKYRLGGPSGRNLPALIELPTDRPRPAVPSYQGRRLSFSLPADLTTQIRSFCRQEEATLFMTLLTAFKVLLLRYSGQEDISVGTPIANRTRAEIELLIGFFVNTLVLRTDLSGAPSFRDVLARVRETAVEAYAHQELPFELLVDALQPERTLNQTPLFQVMFTVQSAPLQAVSLPDLTITPLEADSQTAKFDLTVLVVDRADGLWGTIEYNSDLFEHTTIERMAGHFSTLLASAVADPDQPIMHLPMLSPAEQAQILVAWNATAAPAPNDSTIHELFAAQAARTPDTLAVIYENDQRTFRELDAQANQLACHLQALGVGPDTLVGIGLERSVELVVAILATLKAGGAYLPLDPAYPAERIHLMLDDARPRVVLTSSAVDYTQWGADNSAATIVRLDADWPAIAHYPTVAPQSRAGSAHLAYVIYTSGSTGTPKGVMIEHRQVLNLAAALNQAIYRRFSGEQLRISLNAPPSFDASVQQLVMLIYGHTLDIIPQDLRLDGTALLEFVRERRLDVLDCVPAQLKLLLDAGLLNGQGWAPRLVLPGGEAIDAVTWQCMAAAPATDFFNVYGPTECTVDSTTISAREAPTRASIGRPLANARIYLLDRAMQPVPVGVPGELYIAGAGVGRGYLNRPGLTAEKFFHLDYPLDHPLDHPTAAFDQRENRDENDRYDEYGKHGKYSKNDPDAGAAGIFYKTGDLVRRLA